MEKTNFKPEDHLMKLKGKDYLEVKFRIKWFRGDYKEGDIKTERLFVNWQDGIAEFKADIFTSEGKHLGTGHGHETKAAFHDFYEKAETIAIGRALAASGYGTVNCNDMDEGRIVDGPRTNNHKSIENQFETRGKTNYTPEKKYIKPTTIKISEKQIKFLCSLLRTLEIKAENEHKFLTKILKREITSKKDITISEASILIDYLKKKVDEAEEKREEAAPQKENPFTERKTALELKKDLPPSELPEDPDGINFDEVPF